MGSEAVTGFTDCDDRPAPAGERASPPGGDAMRLQPDFVRIIASRPPLHLDEAALTRAEREMITAHLSVIRLSR